MPKKTDQDMQLSPEGTESEEDSRFLAVLAHELRTPVAAMLTTIELLGETSLDDRQLAYVTTLREAAKSSLQISELLFSVGRQDNARHSAQSTSDDFTPAELLGSVVDLLSPAADVNGIALRLHLGKGLEREVSGDPVAVRQAVTALVDNAIKYTPQGTVRINAALETDGKLDALRIEIRDQGPGILAGERDRIFAAFERGSAQKDVATGYGLGLWITRRVVTGSGGTLRLEPDVTDGACFVMTFPVSSVVCAATGRRDA